MPKKLLSPPRRFPGSPPPPASGLHCCKDLGYYTHFAHRCQAGRVSLICITLSPDLPSLCPLTKPMTCVTKCLLFNMLISSSDPNMNRYPPCLEFSCACSLCESLFKGYLFQEASQKQFELFGFCPLIHPILLPGKSHGQRSLVGFSPWGREESDTTERLHFHFSLSCIGRNGNPLQCPCLENPRDGRAWWAAIYGVTQSRTRLK